MLALGLLMAAVLACSATTVNISSLKLSSDDEGKNEAKSFKPGDKVYAIAQISNNPGKVQRSSAYFTITLKEKLLAVEGAEKKLDVEGSRPAVFWITLPNHGFRNGRYKLEGSMLTEAGEQKDQETATFDVVGY